MVGEYNYGGKEMIMNRRKLVIELSKEERKFKRTKIYLSNSNILPSRYVHWSLLCYVGHVGHVLENDPEKTFTITNGGLLWSIITIAIDI